MKEDLLQEFMRKYSRRITKDEKIAGNRQRFSDLGLDENDIKVMANSVGLQLDDLLLLDCRVSIISRPAPAKPGKPGRKLETFDVAVFAQERRDMKPQMTWDEIYRDWMRTYPNDKRVTSSEIIRDAFRRHFGDKSKDRKRAPKKP